jgi:hypothetical protein
MLDSQQKIKTWADNWEAAEKAMAEIKKQELTDPDYYNKTMASFGDMLNYAADNSPVEQTSGLIEMQKYFIQLGRKNDQLI